MNRLKPRGLVLIIVLVSISLFSMIVYSFVDRMVIEHSATQQHGRQVQSRLLVQSAADAVRSTLADSRSMRLNAGGLYQNSSRFQQVPVGTNAQGGIGVFDVTAAGLDASGYSTGIRYGLEDESAKLNLNTLDLSNESPSNQDPPPPLDAGEGSVSMSSRQRLMALPNMTEDVADAILDWLDTDDQTRDMGAEQDYYTALPQPYAPRNGPLASLDELLLVRGVTSTLLYGGDLNRDGAIDLDEQETAASASSTGAGAMDRGWSTYLTIYSAERNVNVSGEKRIDLNSSDLAKLHEELSAVIPADWATFVIAYRQFGPHRGPGAGEALDGRSVDLKQPAREQIGSPLDLIDARVQIPMEGRTQPTIVASPFGKDPADLAAYLPPLLDSVMTNRQATIAGRININQAPRAVLLTIPGVTETIADAILARREPEPASPSSVQRHAEWIVIDQIVDLNQMKQLSPFVNTAGDVFRARVTSTVAGTNTLGQGEFVVDGTSNPPRVVFWRESYSATIRETPVP